MNGQKNINIIKASAGTGKTFNLVKNYLAHLLQDPSNYYHVLGLTFTKKAAAEMKKRILEDTLKIIENPNSNQILNQIQLHQPFIHINKAIENAELLLKSILFEYSRFEFQTLDSFFYKIVKVFGKDLEIHPNFQMEEDTELFIELCLHKLFKESCVNEELKKYLLDFILYRFEENDSWNLDFPIQELTKEILKDTSSDFLDISRNKSFSDFENLKQIHLQFIKDYENQVLNLVREIENKIEPFKDNPKNWVDKSRGLPSKIKKLKKLKAINYDNRTQILNFLLGKKYFSNKSYFQELENEIYEIALKLNNLMDIQSWKTYKTHLYAYKSLQTSALIFKLWDIGEKIKSENQFILMSDIHIKIKNFLKEEPAEYLYWRLGNRYYHFLLDEFQDTSVTQYENLKPLIENVITTKPQTSSALFVGDVKQSIYRWRGSQPSLLQNLHQDATFSYYANQKVLNTNFRSSPEIVTFVNEFFDEITKIPDEGELKLVKENFKELNQNHQKKEVNGYVKIQKVEKKAKQEDTQELIDYKDSILLQVLELLKNPLKDCNDITILVRTNSESRNIANFLAQNQISFTASESLLMSNSLIIQFLFEALKWIHYPKDPVAQLTVSNLAQNLNLTFCPESFQSLFDTIKTQSLYEQTEFLIQYFQLYQSMNDEIIQFLEFVHQYENREYKKNLSFWDWFDRYAQKESLQLSSKEHIKIMTIHQSKGLEFDVVICPFLNWNLYPKANSKFWGIYENQPYLLNYNKELKYTKFITLPNSQSAFEKETIETILENTNILYVALTRAKKQFYGWFLESKNNHKTQNVSDYFEYFFQKNDIEKIYEKGSFSNDWEVKSTENQNEKKCECLNHYEWKNKILLKPIDENDWNMLITRNEAIKRGLTIHKIFEKLKYFSDLEQIIDDFIAQGKILPSEKSSIIEKIQALFENPLMKLWFSENVFILKEQKFIQKYEENKIPDRMVIHQDILYIIDFKTGQKYPEHQEQLLVYEKMITKSNLKDIKNFHTIKKYLAYIDENEILEVN